MAVVVSIAGSAGLGLLSNVFTMAVGRPTPNNLGLAIVVLLVNLVLMVVALTASVLFLVWIHHAATNVRTFGHQGLAFEPSWCVAWWFIPVASLWKPYQAMREVWQASDPEGVHAGSPGTWMTRPAPGTLLAWWLVYMGGGFVVMGGSIGQALANLQHGDPAGANVIIVVGQLFSVAAAVLVIGLVRRIDANQLASWEKVSGGAQPAVSPY